MTQVARDYLKSPEDISIYFLGSLLSGGGSSPTPNTPEAWADMIDGYQQQAAETPLGIPLLYGVDAVHGHNNVVGATIFPHNIGLGAANDPDLAYRIARATALEAAATGVDWNFGPCLTVPQDERWGRTFEGFSEDPLRVSPLGAAMVRGYQGEDLSSRDSIMATIKHFVGDGGTLDGVDRGDTAVSEEDLRRIHLYPYQESIDEGAASLMASFSSWQGEPMHSHSYLLQDVLREEMGFQGLVVSDWAALTLLPGSNGTQIASAINAGIDMVMVPDDYRTFIPELIHQVEEGNIPEERIDEAVRRILWAKFELGLFEDALARREYLPLVGSEEHRSLAREAVQESLVLLKNDGVLPLDKDLRGVVVTGPLSDDIGSQCGGWTISWQGDRGDITPGTSVLEGVREVLGEKVPVYRSLKEAEGHEVDAVILVIGEAPYAEMKGDRTNLVLTATMQKKIREAAEGDVPLITLLISGRPMILGETMDQTDAFVACWLPGTEGGGIADVLFGDAAFTGTLPFSWPRSMDQIPINAGDASYYPLFPLGYGLGYE